MRPRCLLSCVDRLPTISEMFEEEEDTLSPGCSMEEYMDSIRELSQPPQPCYPLHGPLRRHRHWGMPRNAPCSLPLHYPGPYTARSPLELTDVFLNVRGRPSKYFSQHSADKHLVDHFVVDKQLVDHFVVDKQLVDHFVVDKQLVDHFVVDKQLVDRLVAQAVFAGL